jgi:tetratricopeptide (TPR) repeat protein
MCLDRTSQVLLIAFGVLVAVGRLSVHAEPADFPQDARNLFEKGQDLQKKGQHEKAIQAYDEAIRLGMKAYPRVHLYRANSFLDLKKYKTAIAQYTRFLQEFSVEDSCRH